MFAQVNCIAVCIRENLKLSTDDLLSIEKRLFSHTIQESKYLEMDVGSPEEILIEANRLLFEQYATVESLLDEKILGEKAA